MQVTDAQCVEYAEAFIALPEGERLRKAFDIAEQALAHDSAHLIIVVALILRDRGLIDWAEFVLQLATKIPVARTAALFELSVIAALTRRPRESVTLLERLEAEQPLNGYQQRSFAHQLIRLDDRERATARLEAAQALEPWLLEDHVALDQFATYREHHPAESALARCEALKKSFNFRTPDELAGDVLAALEQERPYSLIRVNDGEGAALSLSISDESEFYALYNRNRREFHVNYWFGDDSMMSDPAYMIVCKQLNNALFNTDCLGAYHREGLEHEYLEGSRRNIPCLFNVVRKLEDVAQHHASRGGKAAICNPHIAHALLYPGHLERFIEFRPRLGVISCHAGLPEALKRRFGLSEVFFHKTPGEATVANKAHREPFGVWHERLMAELSDVKPGVLYLVGAGIPGKVYCDMIKRAGGLALDIGAVADIWMRAPTRAHAVDFEAHGLEA